MMHVTVAIPCYNGEQYVGQAIEAILAQSRRPDEVVIVDDGSTDGSAVIASRYPVRLIRHEINRGLAAARNTAIEAAKGDVIVFVDVDAFADRSMLSTLLKHYERPQVGGVGGQGIEVNVYSLADRWRRAHASQSHGKRAKKVEFLFGLCMSFRLDALRAVGGFNPAFRTNAEDIDIGIRLNQAGYTLWYEPAAIVYHQRRDDEASLERTMIAWFGESYRARAVNRAQPWKMFAGSLRRLVIDPLYDIVFNHDLALARLSWRLGMVKLGAIWDAYIKARVGARSSRQVATPTSYGSEL